ncbi:MAG TPA: helix-turn-helix domain-containing protein [Mycobacteriales bacterium]|nr:helix-turn-helix domain-containing protein [Mycobacteriales bacterium]
MYHRIVVGNDGSPNAERAVDAAGGIARLTGGSVHIVTAYRPVRAAAVVAGAAAAQTWFGEEERMVDDQVVTGPQDQPVVSLSQGKLAELAGGSRQSVNAALSSFVVRGLVRVESRRIVITNLPGLRARAGLN